MSPDPDPLSYPLTRDAIFGIAHDLGAPFRLVAELTRLVEIEHSDLPADTLETLALIRQQGEKGGLMMQGLLSLEAAESVEVNFRTVELGELEALSGPGSPTVPVETDPKILDLALGELIDNAKRYGKFAKPLIRWSDQEVTIVITDGGPGISEDRWLDALRPFVRLSGALTAQALGLGLTRAVALSRRAGGHLGNHSDGVGITLKKAR